MTSSQNEIQPFVRAEFFRTVTCRRGRGQRGFALSLTLVLILLTALTLGVLFGLLGLTIKATAASEKSAREGRSADAAVEAAIVAMRNNPDACGRSSQTVLANTEFDQNTDSTGDDVKVDVECEPVGGSAASSDQVRIIGTDGYKGSVKWATDCAGAATTPTCTPWSRLLSGSPFDLATSKPGIVHTGPESLRFASGVTVRTGVAALGSNVGGVSSKPALTVSGQFIQGSAGLKLNTGDGPGAQRCGLLGIVDSATFILDRDSQPVCDSADARAVASDPTSIEADSGLVAPTSRPAIPTTCSGSVMTFQPGTYDEAAVTLLNALLDGSKPACRTKTFWFAPGSAGTPGIYSFDAAKVTFADAGSTYVFGAPLGWNPASGGVPAALSADASAQLCDQSASGSTLMLSARTALKHSAGRVSICPSFAVTGEPYPAVYQTTSVPNVVKMVGTSPMPLRLGFVCDLLNDPVDWSTGECSPTRNADFKLAAQGAAKLESLRVLLTGTEGNLTQNNFINRRTVRLQLFGKSGFVCSTDPTTGTPNAGLSFTYELVAGGCVNALKSYSTASLDGMTLRVQSTFVLASVAFSQSLYLTAAEAQVNALTGAVTGSAVTSGPGAWSNVAGIVHADNSLASPQMSCAQLACPVALATRTRAPLVKDHTRRFELSIGGGFSFAGLNAYSSQGVDPRLESLRVDVDLATAQEAMPGALSMLAINGRNFRFDLNARLEIRTPSGTRCVSHDGGVNGGSANERQRLSFSVDTLDDLENGGSCNHSIRTFDELTDPATTLKLAIDMPCVRNPSPTADWLCFQEFLQDDHIWEVRPPSIDRVTVSATTDSYIGNPANSELAIDAAAPGPRKMFRTFGRAWMPLTDLDIHWQGDGGTATLFNNDLVLHGLGSDMLPAATTAFVCCGKPDTREVRIRAVVDGRSLVVATVLYSDVADNGAGGTVYSPGSEVHVLDWRRGRLTKTGD